MVLGGRHRSFAQPIKQIGWANPVIVVNAEFVRRQLTLHWWRAVDR
jgi:hypothetical protein